MRKYSVVTTVFNDGEDISNYLENILSQTYLPGEIVICDGGSKDNTIDVIQDYQMKSSIPINLICGNNLNIAQGFNVAIKNTANDLIGITATGNVYDKDFFKKLAIGMENNGSDVEYSPIRGLNQNHFSTLYNNTLVGGEQGIIVPMASNHGVLIKKEVIEKIGYFYEGYYYAGEDSEFFIRVIQNGFIMHCQKDAVLYWKTPCSLKSYLKQIKVYSISTLQGYSNQFIFKTWLRKVIPFLVLVVTLIISRKAFLILLLMGAAVLAWKTYKLRKENKSFIIWFLNKFGRVYFFARYAHFANDNNKVRRGILPDWNSLFKQYNIKTDN